MSGWITLITNEWRLKLLAFLLAVLMLGAVAFSQNPPTTRSLSVALDYTVRDGFILINPPSKTTITFGGLADFIGRLQPENFIATVDASKVELGPAVKVNIKASYTGGGGDVKIAPPAPIAVNVDLMQVKEVPVQVGVRAAAGWAVTKAVATCPGSSTPNPCKVHFDGPASWQTNLTATATLPGLVDVSSKDSPNQKVVLGNSSGALDITSLNTRPAASLDVVAVNIHVEATPGVTSSTVPLVDSPPSHGPAQGYRVTGVAITPLTVVITGDQTALARVRSITLGPVDLSGATSDFTTQVPVNYPGGVTGLIDTATIKYTITRNPNVA
jgi:YbbR domain-containing protein